MADSTPEQDLLLVRLKPDATEKLDLLLVRLNPDATEKLDLPADPAEA